VLKVKNQRNVPRIYTPPDLIQKYSIQRGNEEAICKCDCGVGGSWSRRLSSHLWEFAMYAKSEFYNNFKNFVSTRVQCTIFRCPMHVKWIARSKQGRKFTCAWRCTTSSRTKWLELQSAKVPRTLACLPIVPQSPSISSSLSSVRGRLVYGEKLFYEVVPIMTPNIEIMQSIQHDDDPSIIQGKFRLTTKQACKTIKKE
jgi:hypothetical protein